jgi:hypothetical protein
MYHNWPDPVGPNVVPPDRPDGHRLDSDESEFALPPVVSGAARAALSVGTVSALIAYMVFLDIVARPAWVWGAFVAGIAAIVIGIVALRRLAASDTPRSGKALAVAGLVTGAAGAVVAFLLR